ncbi:MAG: hypothetical protein GEU81_05955 [Nitriliruptorales bacterium]|nr:hypothetical protein [Nitriliruptorales bacterium]
MELGFFVALTLGQQRWIKTLAIGHHELAADPRAGLATTARPTPEPLTEVRTGRAPPRGWSRDP